MLLITGFVAVFGLWGVVQAAQIKPIDENLLMQIQDYIEKGDKAALVALMNKEDVDVNEIGFGQSLLHMAALNNKPDIIKFLFNRGASLETIDDSGNTPIFEAIKNSAYEAVKLLVSLGAHWDAYESLNLAIARRDDRMVLLLKNMMTENQRKQLRATIEKKEMERKAKPLKELSLKEKELTAIKEKVLTAITKGDKTALLALLDNGYPINGDLIQSLWSPLHLAAKANQPEIILSLLGRGANIEVLDAEGGTPLLRAIEGNSGEGNKEAVAILLDKGAAVTEKVLRRAALTYLKEDIRKLIEHSINVKLKKKEELRILKPVEERLEEFIEDKVNELKDKIKELKDKVAKVWIR